MGLAPGESESALWLEAPAEVLAYDLPSIWLIGRDGKDIARHLRGAAIKETVDRSLRSN
jgi:hypothetical protein